MEVIESLLSFLEKRRLVDEANRHVWKCGYCLFCCKGVENCKCIAQLTYENLIERLDTLPQALTFKQNPDYPIAKYFNRQLPKMVLLVTVQSFSELARESAISPVFFLEMIPTNSPDLGITIFVTDGDGDRAGSDETFASIVEDIHKASKDHVRNGVCKQCPIIGNSNKYRPSFVDALLQDRFPGFFLKKKNTLVISDDPDVLSGPPINKKATEPKAAPVIEHIDPSQLEPFEEQDFLSSPKQTLIGYDDFFDEDQLSMRPVVRTDYEERKEKESVSFDQKVKLVMEGTGCTKEQATVVLTASNGDVTDSILLLTQ